MRILVVEDDDLQRITIKTVLEDEHTVIARSSASEALAIECDLAIIDLNIKDDLSGITLAEQIRRENPDTKIIIYTETQKDYTRGEARKVADLVVTKSHKSCADMELELKAAIHDVVTRVS